MKVKAILDEDFSNYKVPSMFIGCISCNGKCCIEAGIPLNICHNDGWRTRAPIVIDDDELCNRYLNNHITQAIVFGGLEPMEQFEELVRFIRKLRLEYNCVDDIVIYTGYYPEEIENEIYILKKYKNIVIKYGRFVPDKAHRFDEVLGVELASFNQYAERIS